MINVISGTVSADKILIDKKELSNRLKASIDFEHSMIDLCADEFNKNVKYRYAYCYTPVSFIEKNVCDIGFGKIESKNLYNLLDGCNKAIILGVTTGISVDRLLNRLSVSSLSKHFITDAIASAAVESLCDYMDNILRKNPQKNHRFSAGYGDLSLEIQPQILKMINADKTLGISINKSLLMTPVKSITAIMGVNDE